MGWSITIHEPELPSDVQQQEQQHHRQSRPCIAPKPHHDHRRPSIPAGLKNETPNPSLRNPSSRRRSSILCPTDISTLRLAHQKSLTSRLLALPPELRNQIYTTYFEIVDGSVPRIRPDYTLPSLLKTCRQIFSEAIGLYYSAATAFRCLDESSAVSWLCALPEKFLASIKEVRYDTRWIIFVTPYIPVPGAECWLLAKMVDSLQARGFEVGRLMGGEGGQEGRGTGKLKVSFYRRGAENGVVWTNKPGLIEVAGEGAR